MTSYMPPYREGKIMFDAYGYPRRIEGPGTVEDMVQLGDLVSTHFVSACFHTNGIVVRVIQEKRCTCPHDTSGTLLCYPNLAFGRPAIPDYHHELVTWCLGLIDPEAPIRQTYEPAFFLPGLVAFDGKIMFHSATNQEEVFILRRGARSVRPLSVQLKLFGA